MAVHLACESLRRGESTLALAGGVNINLMPKSNVFFSKAGALSPNGRCRTFDRDADGMVRSDGAGVVVLKTLSQATRDGDTIVALIKGTAVNHDGRSNGLMAPNGEAQQAVLTEAYRRAGVAPADVRYIEAHGTGTRLGDPIEVQALGAVLTHERPAGRRCLLGSVKTNIGHSEAAAAIAGVIKTALAMKHRVIPPTLHFTEPNPLIAFDRLPFDVPREASRVAIAGRDPDRGHQRLRLRRRERAPGAAGSASCSAASVDAPPTEGIAPGVRTFTDSTARSAAGVCAPPWLRIRASAGAGFRARGRRKRPLTPRSPASWSRGRHAPTSRRAGGRCCARIARCGRRRDLRRRRDGTDAPRASAGARRRFSRGSGGEAGSLVDDASPSASAAPIARAVSPEQDGGRLVFVFSGPGLALAAHGRATSTRASRVFKAALDECDRLFARLAGWSIVEEIGREADAVAAR